MKGKEKESKQGALSGDGKEGRKERTGQSSELEKSTGVRKKAALQGKSRFAALHQKPPPPKKIKAPHQLCHVHTSWRCYRCSVVAGHGSAVLFPLWCLLCRLHFDLWRFGVGWQVVGGLQQLQKNVS